MNYVRGWERPDLLVCDEAHLLKNQVRSFATIEVRYNVLKEVGQYAPQGEVFAEHQDWAEGVVSGDRYDLLMTDLKAYPPAPGDREAFKRAKRLQALDQSLYALAHARSEWVVTREPYGVVYKPVWIDDLVQRYVLRHVAEGGKTIFMSATILNKAAFCRLHGLDEDAVTYVTKGSVFQRGNRPIIYSPVGKVSREGDRSNLLATVGDILRRHPEERGLIHTVSYKLADAITGGVRSSRFISHVPKDREEALAFFKSVPNGVLVSPSMTTGVDLPYDLLRFQIICKLPFPDLSDPQIKLAMKEEICGVCQGDKGNKSCPFCQGRGIIKDKRGQLAYNYDTVSTLVQAYGRGMRAEDDYCTTYLLDENWKWFRHANADLIPRWFTEAIR
jgi:ATP-dependent DNA helicase DinG